VNLMFSNHNLWSTDTRNNTDTNTLTPIIIWEIQCNHMCRCRVRHWHVSDTIHAFDQKCQWKTNNKNETWNCLLLIKVNL
jgi:hypothetical protein